MKNKQLNTNYQVFRGICAIAVIAIHTGIADVSNGYNGVEQVLTLVLRNAITFPVPCFFFMAGYFMSVEENMDGGGYKLRAFRHRLSRIVIPFLVYSLIYSIAFYFFGTRKSPIQVLVDVITGVSAVHLYYLWVLVVFTLFTPLLLRCVDSRWKSWLVFAVSFVSMVVLYWLDWLKLEFIAFWLRRVVWLPFFYAGLLCRVNKPTVRNVKISAWIIALLIALGLQIIETLFVTFRENVFTTLRFSSFNYASVIIYYVYSLDAKVETSNKVEAFLKKLGDDSYGIYLIHMAFLVVIQRVLAIIEFSLPYPMSNIAMTLLCLITCLIAIKLVKLLLPRKFAKTVLGI